MHCSYDNLNFECASNNNNRIITGNLNLLIFSRPEFDDGNARLGITGINYYHNIILQHAKPEL